MFWIKVFENNKAIKQTSLLILFLFCNFYKSILAGLKATNWDITPKRKQKQQKNN